MDEQQKFKNREGSRLIGGLILVAVGVGLLLRNLGVIFPQWLFSWPVILILIGVYSGVKHRFRNGTWAILIGIGGLFLADIIAPGLRLQPAFWPIIIIGLGVVFIFKPKGMSSCNNHRNKSNRFKNAIAQPENENISAGEFTEAPGDFLRIDSIFSGVNRNVLSKNFKGGKITCIFGGAEVDFMQADINGTAVLKMEMIFGGAKIIVPQNWTVINEIGGVFHGVDDKRKNSSMATDAGKVLLLKGSAVFGGVEIRSY